MMKDSFEGKIIARFPKASDPRYDDVEIYVGNVQSLNEGDKVKLNFIKDES